MNIMIIGGGKVGRRLVEDFVKENHSVVIIDVRDNIIEEIQNDYDVMGICGSGTDIEILDEAGIKYCDLVVCVTDKDEINALCTIIAKKKRSKELYGASKKQTVFQTAWFYEGRAWN